MKKNSHLKKFGYRYLKVASIHLFLQISGFMAVVLVGIWTGHHLGGFSWQSDPKHEFNWHPLLMTLGMIYLYGNGNYS